MDYDIEGDWQLLNTCNYRCHYCFFSEQELGEKLHIFAAPDEWSKAFDASGFRWLLHLTGGEPSAYPRFADLCDALTRRHLISVNSNMTHRCWEDFAEKINPSRVSFVNAGLHIVERERRHGLAAYLRNVELLRDKSFQVFTSLVATSEALRRFDDAIALLAPIQMFPVPKVFRGSENGKWYPYAYTMQERKLFRHYAERSRIFYSGMLQNRSERPTADMFRDDSMLHGEPNYRGLSCYAGHSFFRIEPNGDVFRCGPSKSYGNVLRRTFARGEGPKPCDTSYCFYFCEKYSQKPPLSRKIYRSLRTAGREICDNLLPYR